MAQTLRQKNDGGTILMSRLPFMKSWPSGGPTMFQEKIGIALAIQDPQKYLGAPDVPKDEILIRTKMKLGVDVSPKIHTIREDKKGYWRGRTGKEVECFNWSGKPYNSPHNVFPFKVKLVSVQKIEIKYHTNGADKSFTIEVDGDILGLYGARELARNDGFENLDQFRNWFKKDFTGYILHFTEFRY